MYGWHCESVQSLVGSRPAGEGLRSPHLFQVKALREVEMRVGARAGDYIENPIGVIELIACGTPAGTGVVAVTGSTLCSPEGSPPSEDRQPKVAAQPPREEGAGPQKGPRTAR